jgi:alkylation response protein AidB-like acyl-CoA dehydrogenase
VTRSDLAGSQAAALAAAFDAASLPRPGVGRTAHRHQVVHDLARDNPVWIARLAEGHADALAILSEADRDPVPGARYGVWASRGDLRVDADTGTVSGRKPFCSGLGIVDRALVTASGDGGGVLLDVAVTPGPTVGIDTSGWGTPALAQSSTGALTLRAHPVDAVVGPPAWYLSRPGFWHGACGPAACWAGATAALLDRAEELVGDDAHQRAHLGAMRAATWAMEALLARAGEEIDDAPDDVAAAERRAQSLRHTVERHSADVLDRFGRAFGPRPYVGDADVAARVADIHLYLRQHHAERDLESLGRMP